MFLAAVSLTDLGMLPTRSAWVMKRGGLSCTYDEGGDDDE
jgi:hypothetical protein